MKLAISRLDFKLGLRMLVKYPGLTLVGGLALAFGIAVGAATFEVVNKLVHPTLPFDGGDRLVGIQNWDAAANRPERQILHDFVTWREELRSIEELGAVQTLERNLIAGEGKAEPIQVAEISASAFRLTRVPPHLGRFLVEADEQAGAAPVAVIGYGLWQTRFGGSPAVLGQSIRLDDRAHTVVGVMPEGFAFPVAHSLWVPFRLQAADYPLGQGPDIGVFGRLAPGATLDEAQAELTTLGLRASTDFPDTHQHLRPDVLPYAESVYPVRIDGAIRVGMYSINLIAMMFLALICANVATLVFARTATRESEMVVRSALGASRSRIVLQLFTEALVLGGVAAAVGLAAVALGLRWALDVFGNVVGMRPFWWNASLSPATVLYVCGLTVLGAFIVGVVPALRVTGRGVESRLREAAVGSRLRFGGVWTGAIVAQVAVTAAFLPLAMSVGLNVLDARSVEVGFPAEEYLSAWLEMEQDPSGGASGAEVLARSRKTYQELERRLLNEPGVTGVTFADLLPRMDHPQRPIEVDGRLANPDSAAGLRVSSASVDVDYFEVLGTPVLSGRGFHSGDLESGGGVVVVNQSFVDRVLGGRNPIGRRVRYRDLEDPDGAVEPAPWHEIVGVVRDLGMTAGDPGEGAGIYHPVAPGAALPVHLAVHVTGEPELFASRLRAVSAAVDPTLRLYQVVPLDEIQRGLMMTYGFWLRVSIVMGSLLLLLSLAGIYSVMSFTVSRRTREIGIRSALGAESRQIAAAIFSRALVQLGLGVAAGVALLILLEGRVPSMRLLGLLGAGEALMVGTGVLACIVPIRRALRIEPTEALRADG